MRFINELWLFALAFLFALRSRIGIGGFRFRFSKRRKRWPGPFWKLVLPTSGCPQINRMMTTKTKNIWKYLNKNKLINHQFGLETWIVCRAEYEWPNSNLEYLKALFGTGILDVLTSFDGNLICLVFSKMKNQKSCSTGYFRILDGIWPIYIQNKTKTEQNKARNVCMG